MSFVKEMEPYQIALKMMHLPAGMVLRGVVEIGKAAFKRKDESKLAKATAAIGVAVPTLDAVLEYVPVYKNAKDGIVQTFTGGQIQPPDLGDQINDFVWFEIGYFIPEILSVYKQGLISIGKNMLEAIRREHEEG